MRIALYNVELKDDLIPVPYIPKSKCIREFKGKYMSSIVGGVYDNGRVLRADAILQFTCTDIDYKIIKSQYKFDMEIITVATARYGKLPQPLRECVLDYYKKKTDLKDKPSDAEHDAEFYRLIYGKMKALLNSQYGMMAQDPVKVVTEYHAEMDELYKDKECIPQELLEEHNRKAFLVYQWGCWVTSRAREHLQSGIDLCGLDFVYCDTDSCKYIGNKVDWDILNKEAIKTAEKDNTYAIDPNGKKHYMGLFEIEDHMKEFKTLGAKKYAYIDDDNKLHITIAGVNKKIGAIELKRAASVKYGPCEDPLIYMDPGFKFTYAGGLEARYSDHPEDKGITEYITEDGVPIRITRNVSLVPNSKTLGITGEYRELLEISHKMRIDL